MQLTAIDAHSAEAAYNRWNTTLPAAEKLPPGDPRNDTLSKIKGCAAMMNDTRAIQGISACVRCCQTFSRHTRGNFKRLPRQRVQLCATIPCSCSSSNLWETPNTTVSTSICQTNRTPSVTFTCNKILSNATKSWISQSNVWLTCGTFSFLKPISAQTSQSLTKSSDNTRFRQKGPAQHWTLTG